MAVAGILLGRRRAERYDLALDPGEQRDLGVAADDALLAELTAWQSARRATARAPLTVELAKTNGRSSSAIPR